MKKYKLNGYLSCLFLALFLFTSLVQATSNHAYISALCYVHDKENGPEAEGNVFFSWALVPDTEGFTQFVSTLEPDTFITLKRITNKAFSNTYGVSNVVLKHDRLKYHTSIKYADYTDDGFVHIKVTNNVTDETGSIKNEKQISCDLTPLSKAKIMEEFSPEKICENYIYSGKVKEESQLTKFSLITGCKKEAKPIN